MGVRENEIFISPVHSMLGNKTWFSNSLVSKISVVIDN